jgi:hypothetical protein
VFRGEIKNSERALHWDEPSPRFHPSCFIVNEQNIGANLFGQGDLFSLTLTKRRWKCGSHCLRRSDRRPFWKMVHPNANRLWSTAWVNSFATPGGKRIRPYNAGKRWICSMTIRCRTGPESAMTIISDLAGRTP